MIRTRLLQHNQRARRKQAESFFGSPLWKRITRSFLAQRKQDSIRIRLISPKLLKYWFWQEPKTSTEGREMSRVAKEMRWLDASLWNYDSSACIAEIIKTAAQLSLQGIIWSGVDTTIQIGPRQTDPTDSPNQPLLSLFFPGDSSWQDNTSVTGQPGSTSWFCNIWLLLRLNPPGTGRRCGRIGQSAASRLRKERREVVILDWVQPPETAWMIWGCYMKWHSYCISPAAAGAGAVAAASAS